MPIVQRARDLAMRAHAEQRYGDGTSYVDGHLEKVVDLLVQAAAPPIAVAAGWLHDVLEDTGTTDASILSLSVPDSTLPFMPSDSLLRVVRMMTATKGASRAERLTELVARFDMARVNELNIMQLAAGVKVADRLANVRSCWSCQHSLLFCYFREHMTFRHVYAFVPPWGQKMMSSLDSMLDWPRSHRALLARGREVERAAIVTDLEAGAAGVSAFSPVVEDAMRKVLLAAASRYKNKEHTS